MGRVGFSWSSAVAVFVLVLLLGWHGWWASRNWTSSGLSGHEFRQAQTALTIQAILDDGYQFDYATPVLGKPWSIPMEFPLYQIAVAKVCGLFGLPLAEGGRWVSLVCFGLALPALGWLVRMTGLSRGASCLALGPVILAPVYVFYSRTVMIESMALAASAWFLLATLQYRRQPRAGWLALALIAGVVAVLVKPTTWAVFCLPWAFLHLHDTFRWIRHGEGGWRRVVVPAVLIGLPLLAVGFSWVAMADAIKAFNPNAQFLESSALRNFNFGTVAQRLDANTYVAMFNHWGTTILPPAVLLPAVVIVLLWRKTRLAAALGLGAFLLGQGIFLNLYLLHDYYYYANAVMLCLAVGVGIGTLWDLAPHRLFPRPAALILLAGLGAAQFGVYRGGLLANQSQGSGVNNLLETTVRALTEPDDVIVVHAETWAAILPYFSHRRALMIPDFQMYFARERVARAVANLRDESVPLLIVMGNSRDHADWIAERVGDLSLQAEPLVDIGDFATVWAARSRAEELRFRLQSLDSPYLRRPKGRDLRPSDERIQISGTEHEAVIAQIMTPLPDFVVVPFGIGLGHHDGQAFLGGNATSEFHFQLEPEQREVEFGYRVNPASFEAEGFDGVTVLVEQRTGDGLARILYEEWVNPAGDRSPREVTVPLEPLTVGEELWVRILPGPAGNSAFDQVWIEYVRINDGNE